MLAGHAFFICAFVETQLYNFGYAFEFLYGARDHSLSNAMIPTGCAAFSS